MRNAIHEVKDLFTNRTKKQTGTHAVLEIADPLKGYAAPQRTSVLLREVIWPLAGELVCTPFNLEISADFLSRAIDAAVEAGPMVGLCLVHTHPKSEAFGKSKGCFSERDDWYENRLFSMIGAHWDREGVARPRIYFAACESVSAIKIWLGP